ncbi:hypothetical protein CEP51_012306 [Fusarium floridanum]|uniref:Uncharacterized protein n=1 Tax=Fusarium floridanum TaxID=1325733 RepID=A0A428QWE1_9HYPO|nr:hypothetical protein CEP51_012306 [Fusarium floridanum]
MTRPVLGSPPPVSRKSGRDTAASKPDQSQQPTELLWWTLELHLINPYLLLRNTSATPDFAIIDTTLL